MMKIAQYNLAIVRDNFIACRNLLQEEIIKKLQKLSRLELGDQTFYGLYEFDSLTYRATVQISVLKHHKYGIQTGVTLRLSNNGFLYGSPDNFVLKDSNAVQHHTVDEWYLLDKKYVAEEFKDIQAFAFKLFSLFEARPIDDEDSVKSQLLYSSEGQRMDLKFKHRSVIVSVQFEPGFPETYFDEDRWS